MFHCPFSFLSIVCKGQEKLEAAFHEMAREDVLVTVSSDALQIDSDQSSSMTTTDSHSSSSTTRKSLPISRTVNMELSSHVAIGEVCLSAKKLYDIPLLLF